MPHGVLFDAIKSIEYNASQRRKNNFFSKDRIIKEYRSTLKKEKYRKATEKELRMVREMVLKNARKERARLIIIMLLTLIISVPILYGIIGLMDILL